MIFNFVVVYFSGLPQNFMNQVQAGACAMKTHLGEVLQRLFEVAVHVDLNTLCLGLSDYLIVQARQYAFLNLPFMGMWL